MAQSSTHSASLGTREEVSSPSATIYRLTGVLLMLSVVGFFVPFVILRFGLGFLDQPASVALSIFRQQSATVQLSFYTYVWGGLFLSLAVLLLHRIFQSRGVQSVALDIATVCGVLGGLMQAIGDLRWPFLLPSLASTYFDPQTSQATHAAIEQVFQAVDQIAGVGLSEHLSFLFLGAWSLLLGWYLLRSANAARWVAWVGIIGGCAFWIGSIEQFDLPGITQVLQPILLLAHILWGVLLLALAWTLFSRRVNASNHVAVERK
jgi:hypothetical protein